MFDPLAFATVAGVAAAGFAGSLIMAGAAALVLYRPGNGRRRRIRD
jgi:hypothetical protein